MTPLALDGSLHRVTTFPPELIVEILRWATHGKNGLSPFALAGPCQAWRILLISDPSFWTSIDLDIGLRPRCYCMQMDLLAEWMSRAGNLALSVTVKCSYREILEGDLNPRTTPDNHIAPLVDSTLLINLIVSKSSQIRSLCLSIPPVFFTYFRDHGDVSWPMLSHLSLSNADVLDAVKFSLPDPLTTFQSSPLLRQVSILRFYVCLFVLPWNEIQSPLLENPPSRKYLRPLLLHPRSSASWSVKR